MEYEIDPQQPVDYRADTDKDVRIWLWESGDGRVTPAWSSWRDKPMGSSGLEL